MKAILMKVNYSSKYTNPHKRSIADRPTEKLHQIPPHQSRKSVGNNVSGIVNRTKHEEKQKDSPAIHDIHRQSQDSQRHQINQASSPSSTSKLTDSDKVNATHKPSNSEIRSSVNIREDHVAKHREGVAKAHSVIRLKPVRDSKSPLPNHQNGRPNVQIQRLLDVQRGPYAQKNEKRQTTSIAGFNGRNLVQVLPPRKANPITLPPRTSLDRGHPTRSLPVQNQQTTTVSFSVQQNSPYVRHQGVPDDPSSLLMRSRTVPFERARLLNSPPRSPELINMERRAKVYAERAVRNKKIFSIVGPYPTLRSSLRRRGWVEKFMNAPPISDLSFWSPRKPLSAGSDDDNSDDDSKTKENKTAPWEEENGKYNLMSHIVRDVTPTFAWTVKALDIEKKFNKTGQIVNHFGRTGSITTKVGLVSTMKNVHWFENVDPDTFFPRCYQLNDEYDREAFIEDFRITSCISLLKYVIKTFNKKKTDGSSDKENTNTAKQTDHTNPTDSEKLPREDVKSANRNSNLVNRLESSAVEVVKKPLVSQQSSEGVFSVSGSPPSQESVNKSTNSNKSLWNNVAMKVVEACIHQCERFLRVKDHCDIDGMSDVEDSSEIGWDQIIHWFYKIVHEKTTVPGVTEDLVKSCEQLLESLKHVRPQHELDGMENAWIVKPGSLSRGRGIMCCKKLEEILNPKSDTFIAQKYIESPLLIYKTKFDIRQWFLVTDWNPLTVWFYKDSYLRFCSQEYTLDNFHQSIHLANNSVQKYYKNGVRAAELPDDNMWSSEEFQEYLRDNGHSDVWKKQIYSGMKKAVIAALLSTQENVENRKFAFALYGADFMVTEDFKPWLLEINSSPTMARSTRVTQKLCDSVLEDTMKVVLDRKQDKNSSTGRFELAYRQPPITDPPPTDITMAVTGKALKRKSHGHKERQPTLRTMLDS